jgi:MFS family permease
MLLSKRRFRFVQRVIASWESENVITSGEADRLRASIELAKFDWKRLARYSFWLAGVSLGIAIFSLIFDDTVLGIIMKILAIPDILISVLFAVFSAGFYYWGFRRKKRKPARSFSNEFLLFVGAILTGVAVGFLGMAVDSESSILLASAIYLVIGGAFPSSLMWVLGLLSFGLWLGVAIGYASGWGALRFVLLGGVLVPVGLNLRKTKIAKLAKPTSVLGLLYFFIALWILSAFGAPRHEGSRFALICWSLLLGVAAIGAIIWGLKTDDATMRKFGVTFLFINLYTKYFEFFWGVAHKAIFFTILALSFWVIGRYSEKIWNSIKAKVLDDDG